MAKEAAPYWPQKTSEKLVEIENERSKVISTLVEEFRGQLRVIAGCRFHTIDQAKAEVERVRKVAQLLGHALTYKGNVVSISAFQRAGTHTVLQVLITENGKQKDVYEAGRFPLLESRDLEADVSERQEKSPTRPHLTTIPTYREGNHASKIAQDDEASPTMRTLPLLQFRVLRLLIEAENRQISLPGAVIRDQIRESERKRSYPAFYQLMGRMEQAGLVRRFVREGEPGPSNFPQKFYEVTDEGKQRFEASKLYYENLERMKSITNDIELGCGG